MTAAFPDGHFYSPVVDPAEVRLCEEQIWPNEPEVLGIDFNDQLHVSFLTDSFQRYYADYDYPEHPVPNCPTAYYTRNPHYSWLDSRTLFVMLREYRPARMIEIGSGFSSLLTADVNARFLEGKLDFTCIEPYPSDFLLSPVSGLTRMLPKKVQEVPLEAFEALNDGDFLFIDSSHVSKTGSDVNYIYFEILPRLKPGVVIHIHDMFLPFDYPKEWVFEGGRSWNEQYLVRALLMYSTAFKVVFACRYATFRYPELLRTALKGKFFGGAGLWLRKTQ